MGTQLLRVTARQIIRVYGGLGWRMDWLVDEVKPGGVKLSVEANFPTWWGGPSGMNRLDWHDCDFGTELVYRTRAVSWLPILRTVRVTPIAAQDDAVDVRFELPRDGRRKLRTCRRLKRWNRRRSEIPPRPALNAALERSTHHRSCGV